MEVNKVDGNVVTGKKFAFDVSTATLHILAMLFMLSDHSWATVLPGNDWMTCVGRVAYPIFAFMIVEGFHHTKNLKRYAMRMFVFALISEIPFDLMYSGLAFYPFHQNVMWTFLISLGAMWLLERVKKQGVLWKTILLSVLIVLGSFLLGTIAMVDYYGTGVLMVLTFYFFRGKKWWCYLGQFAVMYWINMDLLAGLCYIVTIFGHKVELVQQGFALLAFIPIWLYQGRQGYHSKWFQYFCYAFYPVHMLLLFVIQQWTLFL